MDRSTQLISASAAVAILAALVWLKAPVIPALIGGTATGLILYLRGRRAAQS